MKQARNVLFRVVFILEFRGRKRVKSIQDRTSVFAGGRLLTVMTEGLAAMGNPEQTFFFDKVDFNVGKISLDRLENDLADGITRCLRQWVFQVRPLRPGLMLVFSRDAANPTHDDPDEDDFLLEPSSRPRAAIVTTHGLSAAVAAALQKPADWSEFMMALRDNHALRTRLADEVSPKLLGRLVQSMSPAYGATIMVFAETMLVLYKRQPLASVSIYAFRRILWECIFFELGRSPRTTFSLSPFTRSVLKLMAARVSRSYAALATDIRRLLDLHSENMPGVGALKTALLDLDAQPINASALHSLPDGLQHLAVISEPSELREQAVTSTSRRLADLENFLQWGALPWASSSITGHRMETVILDLLAATPDEVCALIQRIGETGTVRKRLASQFSGQTMTRLLGRLAPTCSNWMTSYMHQFRRLHAQRPLISLRNREFAHFLSELCFEYLVQQNWQSFTPQTFLQHLLRQLAARERKSYESLLADVTLRHEARHDISHTRGAFALPAGLGHTLLTLVDQAIAGLSSRGAEVPRFLVKPEFHHLYSDIDVLAYWLRWHKLPSWNKSSDADEIVRRIGPLLRDLPDEVQDRTEKPSPAAAVTVGGSSAQSSAGPSTAKQIEHWLIYGVWPDDVSAPENSQLAAWLQNQSDADWLKALEGRGASEAIIDRISRHLSTPFFVRIAGLLSGQSAGLVNGYLHSLEIAGRRIAPMATPLWIDQLKKYTLIYLLRAPSVSGRQTISVLELARSTMVALSLRCRVPYERLLNSVEKESHGQQDVQNLCHSLRQELEADESNMVDEKESFPGTKELQASALPENSDIVLHYLKHGSLPEFAHVSSIVALRRMAGRFSDQQLSTLARECFAAIAASDGCARRIATTLSAKKTFVQFVSPAFTNAGLISELEDAVPALAARFAVPSRPLVVESRIFMLRQSAGAQIESVASRAIKTVLSGLIQYIARYLGAQPAAVWKELLQVAGNQRLLAQALSELEQAAEFKLTDSATLASQSLLKTKGDGKKKPSTLSSHPQETRSHDASGPSEPQLEESQLSRSRMPADQTENILLPLSRTRDSVGEVQSLPEPAEHEPLEYDVRGRLHALSTFLLTGSLPWWAEEFARESSRDWLATPLAQHPQLVLSTLRSLSGRPEALKRLKRHVPASELEQIVHAASPEYGGILILYIYAGELLSQFGDTALSAVQKSRAGAIHWNETLGFILEKHASVPSPKESLRELTIRVAHSLGLARDRYTTCLLRAIHHRAQTQGEYAALSDMLAQINVAAVTDDSQHPEAAHTADAEAISRNSTPSHIEPDVIVEPSASAEVPVVNNGAVGEDAGLVPESKADNDTAKAAQIDPLTELSQGSTTLQQLDYLLSYGTGESPQQVMEQAEQELHERPAEYRAYLMKAASLELERKRMARLFSPAFFAGMWRVMLPSHHADATLCLHAIQEATAAASTGTVEQSCRQISAEELLRTIVQSQGRHWDGPLFLRSVVRRLAEHLSLRPAVLTERLRAAVGRQPTASQERLQAIIGRVDREMAAIPTLLQTQQHQDLQTLKPRPPAKMSRPLPAGEPFYIGNAGAVLLWPFLSRYFQELGLLNKNIFCDETARHRAIQLLQYLVKKEWDAREHQLLLNKILVGVSPEQPLECPAPLTESEEHLSEQLLQGVLKNWEKLRNTSIQGLRDSFLVREGKLVKKDDAWFLTVSTRGYDVLLDSLPWQFSMVRLPWMKTLLHVKWR